ncbi:hypothetical protein [Sediminibacterium goheungense]|uniref:Uncharacterized protein n=1 Tax=Sediminibacterium goheungense TaxID=1086393 RepID=A0A4R6J1C3_9BACT|nr:hypothetical protein [Sediminibacterium goheungense]TDO29040.1 hypothetical protein BC659_1122 [Sediminibacterium goheungense]
MADQEVIKHTKKVYKIWTSKEHGFMHKLKEFGIEVLIIVFAVSLSIWLHGWSEHRTEQKQVKSFLLGLKSDLQEDIEETAEVVRSFKDFDTMYTYLSSLNKDKPADKDTFSGIMRTIKSNVWLRPNMSRYEGFKSSGRLSYIENDALLQNILYLYQEALPQIKSSEGGWLNAQQRLLDFLFENINDQSDSDNRYQLITSARGKLMCEALIPSDQLFKRYDLFIEKSKEIIDQINQQYGLKEK